MSGLRINLGSGQRPFAKPFINVDCQERWAPDVLASGESMPMFEDNSAEMIVAHHFLEHRTCGGGGVLEECYRILAIGGSLLVFVPDMWSLTKMWHEGRMDDETAMITIWGAYMGDEADRHKFGYTHGTLFRTLKAVGFKCVSSFDWREIPGADIARAEWVLGMEAIK